jgi:hypothetical protein
VEELVEHLGIAGVGFREALDDDPVGGARRIGLRDLVADGPVVLTVGVDLDSDVAGAGGAHVAHLLDVLETVVAQVVVARDVGEHRPFLGRKPSRAASRHGRPAPTSCS